MYLVDEVAHKKKTKLVQDENHGHHLPEDMCLLKNIQNLSELDEREIMVMFNRNKKTDAIQLLKRSECV